MRSLWLLLSLKVVLSLLMYVYHLLSIMRGDSRNFIVLSKLLHDQILLILVTLKLIVLEVQLVLPANYLIDSRRNRVKRCLKRLQKAQYLLLQHCVLINLNHLLSLLADLLLLKPSISLIVLYILLMLLNIGINLS